MSKTKRRKLDGPTNPVQKLRSRPTSQESESLAPVDNLQQSESEAGSLESAPKGPTTKSFRDLGVLESLCEACEALGYKSPTPIQEQAIPLALQGRDLIGLAETGSGKTAAFALPILHALMDKPQPLFGLVMAPTRELAYQISQAFDALGSLISVRTAVIVGGMDMVPQAIALGKKPHIVVATPGRLLDHLENTKGFSLKHLKYLVMDEADRLLDLDFGTIIDKILKVLPRETRHTYLFSATMTSKVESLQRASLKNPLRVSVSTDKYQTVSTLLQSYIFIPHKYKDRYLAHLLSAPFAGASCIIFTRTVNETQRISILLRSLGFGAIPLHGQLSQSARLGALGKFRSKSRDILVATDVAARGLDVPSVDLVLNFDLPPDSKTYIHRVGRTARAGKSGHAISMVTQYDIDIWQRIESALGKKLEEYAVDREEVDVLGERVEEAARVAIREMKELHEKRGTRGATLRDVDLAVVQLRAKIGTGSENVEVYAYPTLKWFEDPKTSGPTSILDQTNTLGVFTGQPSVVTPVAGTITITGTIFVSSTPPGGPSTATTRSSASTSPSQLATPSSNTRSTTPVVSAVGPITFATLTSQPPSTLSKTAFQPSTSSSSSTASTSLTTSLPPPSTSTGSPQSSSNSLSPGAKAGIGIGALIAALLIAAAAYYLGKRAKKRKPPVEGDEPQNGQAMYEGLDRKDTVRHEVHGRQAPMAELPGWPRQAQRAELPDREKG